MQSRVFCDFRYATLTENASRMSAVNSNVLLRFDAVLTIELVNTSSGSRRLLLSGIERMALGANLHVDLLLRRTGHELVTTVADHLCLMILGMDSFFHFSHLVILFWMIPNILSELPIEYSIETGELQVFLTSCHF